MGSVLDLLGLIILVIVIGAIMGLIIYSKLMSANNLLNFVKEKMTYSIQMDPADGAIYAVEDTENGKQKRWFSPAAYNSWNRPSYFIKTHEELAAIPNGPDMEIRTRY